MHALLSNLTAIRRKTGIGHYVTELVRALRQYFPSDEFTTFPGPFVEKSSQAWGTFAKTAAALKKRLFIGGGRKGSRHHLREWVNSRARGWAEWHFRTFWSGANYDLYHEPNYIPYPFDKPTIATIHDLSVMLHPQWHPPDRVAYYEHNFESGLKRCAHLLADSQFTRQELIENFQIAPEKVSFVPLGMRADLQPLPGEMARRAAERLGLPPRFLLHVGTIEPRKNLLMLLRAFCDLPASVRETCPLVLVGGWGWQAGDIAEFYSNTARHQNVIHSGYVADGDLPCIYSAAQALVFPSHYEGFGLPPLEMLACGGAVIASTAGAVVETVGRQAHLVEAQDEAGWRAAMHGIITDDDWRMSLRRGAEEVARAYTWQRCAEQTCQVYSSVLNIPFTASKVAA